MAKLNGGEILTRQLKIEGVDTVFSLPGDPMTEISKAMREESFRTINFRHEQGSALAAQAYGYVTRKPGVAMVPSGPAMTNAITALETARSNCWPMLLIAGNGDLARRHRGDFQEAPQVESAAPFCKYSVAVEHPRQIPYYVHTAMQKMMYGRPGPVFVDMPSNVISSTADEDELTFPSAVGAIPRPIPDPNQIQDAMNLIMKAERPLMLVGKGLAWSDASEEVRALVDRLQIPFVPSPMGKGVLPDDHPLNASGARSYALANADLVILAGARFNWIFHFGEEPRFDPNKKVVQLDIDPSEIGNGFNVDAGIVGDAKVAFAQMLEAAEGIGRTIESPWLQNLEIEKEKNSVAVEQFIKADESLMNMYQMYNEITQVIDRNAIVSADGENTMAISRVMVPNYLPRHRLDAGASGCMGVSVPYGVGAQVATPETQVFSFNGDYAFGWNGFEAETAARNNLPVVFVVANNISVGGPDRMELGSPAPGGEQPDGIRYDKIMEAFGGHGEYVDKLGDVGPAVKRSLSSGKASLINIVIDKKPARKKQPHDWMTGRKTRMQY